MTALQLFELTMALMDELTSSGVVDPQNTGDYKARTPKLLTVLQGEVAQREKVAPTIINDINDTMVVSDFACTNVIPWGLANLLVLEENDTIAAFCQSKYAEWFKKIPMGEESIEDIYSIYNTNSTEPFRW